MTDCTYCGAIVEAHDPVYVEETVGGERTTAGQFCNYACLTAHVEAAGLTDGACCRWEPAEEP
jgi:hypothetical protein